VGDYSENYRAE